MTNKQFYVKDDDVDTEVISSTNNFESEPQTTKARVFSWIETMWVALSCFFLTIATVLGTGILGLPVKVADSGFGPFCISFGIGIFAQAAIIIYMVELLQKTQAMMQKQSSLADLSSESSDNKKGNGDHNSETSEETAQLTSPTQTKSPTVEVKGAGSLLSKGPDLHTMGKYFLNRVFQVVFDASVVIHFISILIAYSIAGPTAYGEVFKTAFGFQTQNTPYLIAPFVVALTLFIVFGYRFIQPVVSIGTLVKGSMLIVMVALVGVLAVNVNQVFTDNYQYIGRPFLIGTVALGGAMNTLPVFFSKMTLTKRNLHAFRIAGVLAIFVCGIINILWVLFILKIVPQTGPKGKPSLKEYHNTISTVPLGLVIDEKFENFKWLKTLVQIFIMLSITVSFVTLGGGTKHMLDGYVKTFLELANKQGSRMNQFVTKLRKVTNHPALIFQFMLYIFTFGLVYIFAQLNPKAFLKVMEVVTSAALNLESGVFVSWMLWITHRYYKDIKILVPLPTFMIHTLWITSAYFLFAVLYDVVYSPIHLYFDYIGKELPF